MQIILYEFDKNPNSTKRPKAAGLTLECYLLEPTSITAPSLSLQLPGNPGGYNYAMIPEFNRYYFIEDWVANNGRWVASLSVDVLASFKVSIGTSTQYVLRSAAEYDPQVQDMLYPGKAVPIQEIVSPSGSYSNPFFANMYDGAYIVGIINSDTEAVGCVSYYAFTNSQFRELCSKLMSNITWMGDDFGDVTVDLLKSVFNPFQYIVSCIYIPLSGEPFAGTPRTNIQYGWWYIETPCTQIRVNIVSTAPQFILPQHPQAADRGEYLNGPPFSSYTLYWPAVGQIPLNGDTLARAVTDGRRLTVELTLDAVTGKAVVNITAGDVPIYLSSVQIGVPVQLAQLASDYIGFASNMAQATGSAFSFDFAGAAASVGNALMSLIPKMQTSGSNGSTSGFLDGPKIVAEFVEIVDDSPSKRGRPLCAERQLSTLPGYIITADAELEAPCTSGELDRIKGFLNGGFFYE